MEATRMCFGPKTISHLHKVPFCLKSSVFPLCLVENHTSSSKSTKQISVYVKASSENLESTRPLTQFPPSFWGDHFLSVHVDLSEFDALATEINEIWKPRVLDLLMCSHSSEKERIRMIHLLVSLGISHHFETDIEGILSKAFENLDEIITKEDDLETVSIVFEVFRLYNHYISCDVFDRFRGDNEMFKESLGGDVRGMLQLYEAAHLGTPSEVILDEAISFTANHLESLLAGHGVSLHLHKHIKNALYRPRYHNIELLATREYISFYDQEEGHDETLLKFAKINFNYGQLHYIQEIKTLTRWWKDLDLVSKLPYIRDRIVECYVAALGIYFEPQYSLGRLIVAKLIMVGVVLDDTCDAYGTFPEVKTLTDYLQRWDLDALDELPSYLRITLKSVIETMEDIKREMTPRGRSSSLQHTIEEIKILGRANEEISKWARAGHVPTFEEYMKVGLVTAGMNDFACYSYIAMEDYDEKTIYKWFDSEPKIFQALSYMFRIGNDICTYEKEISRGEVANGVNCYMEEHCVPKEEAVLELKKIYKDNYKIMMEEFLTTKDVPRQILVRCLNIGRMIDVFCREADEFTNPHGNLKDHIISLFLHPIAL